MFFSFLSPPPALDYLLGCFESNLLGPDQSQRALRNVRQRKSYVRKFLLFMSGGGPDINRTLLFLNDPLKLNGYVRVSFLCFFPASIFPH